MSRKAETSAMDMTERAEGATGWKRRVGPVIYYGPTVRGVARQYMMFSGGTPEAPEDFSEQYLEVRTLPTPVEQFAETRRKMETTGTTEVILYHRIKSEL